MAIVSYEFYTTTYMGEPLSVEDFPRYDLRAENVIQQITRGATKNFDKFPEDLKNAVQNAICAQIEYFNLYGLDVAVSGRMGGGFTVGKVSVQNGAQVKTGASSMICPAAIAWLEQTGLLNPQVETVGKPFLWWD